MERLQRSIGRQEAEVPEDLVSCASRRVENSTKSSLSVCLAGSVRALETGYVQVTGATTHPHPEHGGCRGFGSESQWPGGVHGLLRLVQALKRLPPGYQLKSHPHQGLLPSSFGASDAFTLGCPACSPLHALGPQRLPLSVGQRPNPKARAAAGMPAWKGDPAPVPAGSQAYGFLKEDRSARSSECQPLLRWSYRFINE